MHYDSKVRLAYDIPSTISCAAQMLSVFVKKEARCVQFGVFADIALLICVSHSLDVGPLSAAVTLDTFLLVMATVGIFGNSATLLVPNIIVKSMLMLVMLFVGCLTIDAMNTAELVEQSTTIVSPSKSAWRSMILSHPYMPVFLIILTFLIVVEVRLFFGAWYTIAFRTASSSDATPTSTSADDVEKHPPSYTHCVSGGSRSASELPSYDEAVHRIESAQTSKQTEVTVVCEQNNNNNNNNRQPGTSEKPKRISKSCPNSILNGFSSFDWSNDWQLYQISKKIMVSILSPRKYHKMLAGAEDFADDVLRGSRHLLPHLARLCLISTFLEDGIRMCGQGAVQLMYIQTEWSVGPSVAKLFLFCNMFGQLMPCILILWREHVSFACAVLGSVVIMQTIVYGLVWNFFYLSRSVTVCGGLILLMAETWEERRSLMAGLPSMGDTIKSRSYLLLIGRVMLIPMFLSIMRFEMDILQLLPLVVGSVLLVLMLIGFKTKLAAMALVVSLFVYNLYHYSWWNVNRQSIREYMKFDFFQILSVIGGLLFVIAHGPGGVSVDVYKKRW